MIKMNKDRTSKHSTYCTDPSPYIDQIAEYLAVKGSLHWSHHKWLADKLTEEGIEIPLTDREMVEAVKRLGHQG